MFCGEESRTRKEKQRKSNKHLKGAQVRILETQVKFITKESQISFSWNVATVLSALNTLMTRLIYCFAKEMWKVLNIGAQMNTSDSDLVGGYSNNLCSRKTEVKKHEHKSNKNIWWQPFHFLNYTSTEETISLFKNYNNMMKKPVWPFMHNWRALQDHLGKSNEIHSV